MQVVSALGYTGGYMAAAVVVTLAVRRPAGLTLLVLLALNGAVTDTAKRLIESPRPHAVDRRVSTPSVLSALVRLDAAAGRVTGGSLAVLPDDRDYGFPSGHASATTAFCLALAVLFPSR